MNYNNYFLKSFGVFKGCKKPKRKPSYISYSKNRQGEYTDTISSMYWYGSDKKGDYVIRASGHWSCYKTYNTDMFDSSPGCGKVASCYWILNSNKIEKGLAAGKIYLTQFKAN